jgi:tetratricopeptide (TPR) repeat protein|tara:strand:- start:12 stop:569 length:558 start_codon:yes stop_codon:yes gene_type:complete
MNLIKSVIFLFILFSTTSLKAQDQDRDVKLNKLFNELKINNTALTYGAEQKIWEIWSTHPKNQKLTEKLAEGSDLVRNKQLSKAVNIFTEVIDLDPKWAEAWNKRATVLYMMGDYKSSQKDIDKVLKLEKRHFGALAGQGLVNIQLKNYEKAIMSYKKAQEIYPSMQSPNIMIKQIENLIKQELI